MLPEDNSSAIVQRSHVGGAMPQRMRLNFDVLLNVLPHIDSSCADLLSFMRTCRTLHSAGAVHLLRFHLSPKLCSTPAKATRKMAAFCRFMLDDASGRRSQHFRQFSFRANNLRHQSVIKAFSKVLLKARYLEDLSIDDSEGVAEVAELHSQLSQALASLPNLKKLRLSDVGEKMCKLLKHMQCPVANFELSFESDWCDEDLVPLLSSFRTTLKKLDVFSADMVSTNTQYPVMQELRLECCGIVDFEPLIRCYPNLRTLRLCDSCEEGYISEDAVEPWRINNRALQTEVGWEKMDLISGELPVVYLFAPMCHVRHLDVHFSRLSSMHMLDPVVSDTTTSHLEVSVWIGDERLAMRDIAQLFQESHPDVTHFSLDLHLDDKVTDITDLEEGIVALIRHLPTITHLVITIRWNYEPPTQLVTIPRTRVAPPAPSPDPSESDSDWELDIDYDFEVRFEPKPGVEPHPLDSYLRSLDCASLARQFVVASSSLRRVGFRLQGRIRDISPSVSFDVVETEEGTRTVAEGPFKNDIESNTGYCSE